MKRFFQVMFHCENTVHAADPHTCDWFVAVRSRATSSLVFHFRSTAQIYPSFVCSKKISIPKELGGNWLAKRCGLECVCLTCTGEKQHSFSNMAVTRQLHCCGGLPLCLLFWSLLDVCSLASGMSAMSLWMAVSLWQPYSVNGITLIFSPHIDDTSLQQWPL